MLAVLSAALRVKATCYTRRAPVSDFALDQARVVDLREHSELKPLIKTNGVGMPGWPAGSGCWAWCTRRPCWKYCVEAKADTGFPAAPRPR